MSAAPALSFEPAPCLRCGAKTEAEAGGVCKPDSNETGEYSCPGEFNAEGISVRPTAESLARLDAWIDRQVAKQEAEESRQ